MAAGVVSQPGFHTDQPVLSLGPEPEVARGGLVLVHGRGGSADGMLALGRELGADGWSCRAPQAANHSWYPESFMAPIEANEPWLGSALTKLGHVVDPLESVLGSQRVVIAGFSQGACLALEFLLRRGRPLGAVLALSGGLIGPPGVVWPPSGRLDGTVVFLGCSDVDPHIPEARVTETAAALESRGADVTTRIYPAMGHTVNDDEIRFGRGVLDAVAAHEVR